MLTDQGHDERREVEGTGKRPLFRRATSNVSMFEDGRGETIENTLVLNRIVLVENASHTKSESGTQTSLFFGLH